jgi:hypothetical protein
MELLGQPRVLLLPDKKHGIVVTYQHQDNIKQHVILRVVFIFQVILVVHGH